MDKWFPIETAPQDGETIILYKPNERMVGEYMVIGYWGEWPGQGETWIADGNPLGYHSMVVDAPQGYPTHWMPKPPPPTQ